MPKVARMCERCGREFATNSSRVETGRGRFCSLQCKNQSQATSTQHICMNCGEAFVVLPSQTRKDVDKYCSCRCRGIALRKSQERTCANCGRSFQPRQSALNVGWGLYCSRSCAAVASRKRIVKDCLECGARFETTESPTHNIKYCSKECRYIAVAKQLSGPRNHQWSRDQGRICEYCGAVFSAKQTTIRRGFAKYCSRSCAARTATGEHGRHWKGQTVKRKCETCSKEFTVKLSSSLGRFCSYACHGQWISQYKSGPNSHNWRGGFSFIPYPATFNEAFKRMIRERDGYRCARCGAPNAKDIHHIDAVKANTIPENCITLCKSCHGKCQGNRAHWLHLYRELIILKAWGTRHKAQIAV